MLSIPPLITRTPLFDIHRDIQQIVPIFTFKHPEIKTMDHCLKPDCWYHGVLNSHPLYLFREGSEGDMCYKLEFSSDLSHMSPTPIDNVQWGRDMQYIFHGQREAYRICGDSSATVSCFRSDVLTASDWSQTRSTYFNTIRVAHSQAGLRSFCPVSARLVCTDSRLARHIVISDFCR